MIKKIRDYTKLPICSGFGIKTPIDAKKVADTGCDGVVVGSSIVEFIEKNANDKKLTQNVITGDAKPVDCENLYKFVIKNDGTGGKGQSLSAHHSISEKDEKLSLIHI